MTDFSTVGDQEAQTAGSADFRPDPPSMVPGRVLHADADFYAYMTGYRWEEEALSTSIEALRAVIQTARIMAGAETIHLHLTMGDKGGRYETAKVQEYQAVRKERPQGLVDRVSELRHWMANCADPAVVPCVWLDQEADDGLTQVLHEAVREGTDCVMWSRDKDLYMAPGIHMNPDTWELEEYTTGFGECHLDDSTTQKKVVGKGTSFFWHQMLMGDGADNIPGLPLLSAKLVEKHWPTQALLKAEDRLRAARTPTKAKAARTALHKLLDKIKPKTCGAVKAFEYLSMCKTDKQAFKAVREAYVEHYGIGAFNFRTWDGVELRLTAGDMLLEQARLLWMRRVHGEDVLDFLTEVANG